MVEQLTLQTLIMFIQAAGILVAVIYHIMSLRNTRRNMHMQLETRQTQLLVDIFRTVNDPDFRERQNRVLDIYDWEDYDDFVEKYGIGGDLKAKAEIDSIRGFYVSVAILLATGRIDAEQLGMHLGYQPIQLWNKFESVILERRRRNNSPYWFIYLEFLKDEMEKRESYPRGKASYLTK